MSGNAQKTHYSRTINRFAEQKVLDAIQITGKSIPCRVVSVSGSIVTVAFLLSGPFTLPNVTCPMFGPEYIRYPTQVDDLGVVMSADYYIGCVSGLGGGTTADLAQRANLSTLIFFPIANSGWSATDNPNAVVIYGPDGVIMRPTDNSNKLTVDKTNVRTSGVLQAGNGATGSVTISGHTITASHGIVTVIT